MVGIVVALELLYFLSLEASVTAYRRFVLVTVGGLVLAVVGGPVAELFAPSLVHWVHWIAALLGSSASTTPSRTISGRRSGGRCC